MYISFISSGIKQNVFAAIAPRIINLYLSTNACIAVAQHWTNDNNIFM